MKYRFIEIFEEEGFYYRKVSHITYDGNAKGFFGSRVYDIWDGEKHIGTSYLRNIIPNTFKNRIICFIMDNLYNIFNSIYSIKYKIDRIEDSDEFRADIPIKECKTEEMW